MSPRTLRGLTVAAAALFFVARTFTPSAPVLLGGDQGFFWLYGERLLRGDFPYRDFFQFTLPGADLVHALAFALLGARVWVTSLLVVLLGTALVAVVLTVAEGVTSLKNAVVAALFFAVFVFGQALTTTHHGWSMLAILGAVVVMGRGVDRPRIAGAGALLALGTFSTQSHGALALVAFALYLGWVGHDTKPPPRVTTARVATLLASYVLALALLCAPFAVVAGPSMASCVVTYVLDLGAASPGRSLGLPEELSWKAAPTLLPFVIVYAVTIAGTVLGAARLPRRGEPGVVARRALLSLLSVCLLVPVVVSWSWVRLFAVSPPGLILFVASTLELRRGETYRWAAWGGVLGLAALLVRSTIRHHDHVVDLPGGRAATDASMAEEMAYLHELLPPGAPFFAVDRPSLYLPLGLHPTVYLDAAVPSRQTTPSLALRTTAELTLRRVPRVLWSTALEQAMPGDDDSGIALLRRYVHDHYRMVRRFGGDELWESRQEP